MDLRTCSASAAGVGCGGNDVESSRSVPPSPSPSISPFADASPAATAAVGPSSPAIRRRLRRRRKHSVGENHSPFSSVIYNENLIDELLQKHCEEPLTPRPRRRGRPPSAATSLSDLDVESLIAFSVGFPSDSLTDDEIAASVLPTLSGPHQANYIVVRNHILSRWRSAVSSRLTESQAMEAIRSEHKALVTAAYSFLLSHSFINFGLSPAFRNANSNPSPNSPSVVVIGAGLAGLAAARQLVTLGFKVVIVEGRSRPGGRVHTRKMEGSGVVAAADLGGSVLTGINGNPLGVMARQLGLPLHKVRDLCPLYLPDGRAVDPAVDSRVELTFNQLLEKACNLRESILQEFPTVDVSLGTALEAFRKAHGVAEAGEERMLLDWHLANLEYANAAKLSDLSMAYWDQDDPYEMGGDHCFIPGGNSQFVRALAEDLPVFYNRAVKLVHYGSDGVIVVAGDKVFRADMALCTVPLGVLKKGYIKFVPELPERKQDAIRKLGFGLLNKVAMLFPHDFWGGEIDTFGHLTEDSNQRGEFFLFYSYSSVSGGPLLVALVAGESAIRFEMDSPAEAVERALAVLRRIFLPKLIHVPEPIQAVCTRWGSDKFTHGSYSYIAVGSSGDDYDVLAESIEDRVFFAGEATNKKYPATMHGALLSGFREAANISRASSRRRRSLEPAAALNVEDTNQEAFELDDFFQTPDVSFGSFSVLHDPCSNTPDSMSLVRVAIGERNQGTRPLYLYGLISRKHVKELVAIDGDGQRLSALYRNLGTRLVGRNGIGSAGEALILRMRSARKACPKPPPTDANGS